jgi:hypothetical protein
VLFSAGDITEAVDEISNRLIAVVSETLPSGIIVHAEPNDAMISINGAFIGHGTTELHTQFPCTVEIAVQAESYTPVLIPLELRAGELSELFINLTPISLAAFEAIVPASPGSRVYLGSLYIGETPLGFQLPREEFAYITVETPEGKTGSVIYRDNELVRGSAQFIRTDDVGGRALFDTWIPISPEEERVERARRSFYRAYGVFWFVLPAALLTAGIAVNYVNAHNYVEVTSYYAARETRRRIYDNAMRGHYISMAAYGAMGISLGVTFYQIYRYLNASGGEVTPVARTSASGARTEP